MLKKCLSKLLLMSLVISGTLSAEETIYETSFEKAVAGEFKKFSDHSEVSWQSNSHASISTKFSKTGQKSLRLSSPSKGEASEVTILLKGKAQRARGLRFVAQRWTGSNPFEFQVEAKINGKWYKIASLNKTVTTGKNFSSAMTLAIPRKKKSRLTALRLSNKAVVNAGVLIDDFALLKAKPKVTTEDPVFPEIPSKELKLISKSTVFQSGTEKTHTFRIPAIITAPNGDILVSCDARRHNSRDLVKNRDIDIVIKRSTDNGKTWGPMEMVMDYPAGAGGTDPSFILDRTTGEIFIFYSYMARGKEFRFRVQSSKDNGKTWSKPRDITDDISEPHRKMSFKFISSGRGSQTRDGMMLHNYVIIGHVGVHIFGSEDHGKTWKLISKEVTPGDESRILEIKRGVWMINSRWTGGFRWVHISKDKGKTWESHQEKQLTDPKCNGAIIRYTSKRDGYKRNRLLFCNASSPYARENLAIRVSYNEGRTWSQGKVIDAGAAAYSEITILKDGSIGVIYEAEPGYKKINFVRFTLKELTDGKDRLYKKYKIR